MQKTRRRLYILVGLVVGALGLWSFRAPILQWGVNRTVALLAEVDGVRGYIDQNRIHYLTEDEARIDVAGAVRAWSASDLAEIRRRAIAFVWKGPLPATAPSSSDDVTARLQDRALGPARRVRSLTVSMAHGVAVEMLFIETAELPRRCLVVYHQDHNAVFLGEREWYRRFLEAGCDVAAVPMPLTLGTAPITADVGGREVVLRDHNDFAKLQTPDFSPIRFFLEPSVRLLNQVLTERGYERIAAVGLSGGGWAATVLAALDGRYTHAYPVAGGLPLYLQRPGSRNRGDWEANDSAFYAVVNYFELYLLGVLEPHRRAVHVFNRYDPCCYKGVLTAGFAAQVEGIARRWGLGSLRFRIDEEGRQHLISTATLDFILEDFLR